MRKIDFTVDLILAATDPQRLQRTNRMFNDNGVGSSNQLVNYNEMQFTKLYRNGADIGSQQTA